MRMAVLQRLFGLIICQYAFLASNSVASAEEPLLSCSPRILSTGNSSAKWREIERGYTRIWLILADHQAIFFVGTCTWSQIPLGIDFVNQIRGNPLNRRSSAFYSFKRLKCYEHGMDKWQTTDPNPDKPFTWGQISLGTLDHGNFDNLVLRGLKVARLAP